MKNFRIIFAFLAVVFVMTSLLICNAFALEVEIVLGDISFDKYIDANGEENSENGTIIVEFSKLQLEGQLTVMLSTEEITDTSADSLSKIIYINQIDVPESNVLSFPIARTRLVSAMGTDNIDGQNLYLKVNGTGGGDAVMLSVKYTDPYAVNGDLNGDGSVTVLDALALLKCYLDEDFENGGMDLNGDGVVSLIDVIRLLKLCAVNM